jgi:tetratricopeptide (TPR) repeat protein
MLAQQPEQAIGLVLASAAGKLRRTGSQLPLTAKAGDILFEGDALLADGGTVSFLYCPTKSSQKVAGVGEVVIGSKQLAVKAGQLSEVKQEEVCFLPRVERESVAGQKHLGVSLTGTRSLVPATAAGSLETRIAKLSEQERTALLAELSPVDKILASDARNIAARVARAAILEKFRLGQDALEEYRRIQSETPDAVWVRSRLFVHEQEQAAAAPAAPSGTDVGGKTYALLVGISTYQIDRIVNLRYAHDDALLFQKHLKSPRGGGLSDSDITVLTNEHATLAAVRNAFDTLLKRTAGKQDTVLLFFAAHGTTTDKGIGYIITHDSDPQDLASTALPMRDLQRLFREELSHVGRVLMYVDVCRAGSLGALQTRGNRINTLVENLTDEGEMFGMLASRKDEVAIEGPQFGGGHGAFSYFLLDALNGAADANNNEIIDAVEIVDYVTEKVQEATASKQNPKEIGDAGSSALAMTNKPGITLQPYQGAVMIASRDAQGESRAVATPSDAPAQKKSDAITRFVHALDEGRLLPDNRENAFTLLAALRKQLAPDDYLVYENRLRIALENRGQQVLLRYLTGDQIPQAKTDFMAGAAYFSTARLLTPESLLLAAREDFCLGRAALFDKDYRKAADLLERAVRIDSTTAYGYNALGISYLEQAKYDLAILAFRDAIARAPYWAYPLHNAALAYIQMGDYDAAIRSYSEAIRLAPKFSYLPYNLGLIYQRLNRRKEAEAAYRKAIQLAPELAEPYNALGYLKASTGDRGQAELHYREALVRNPAMAPAKHNLALLLAQDMGRFAEAAALWQEVLAKSPDYLPSRLSLAKALASHGRTAEAISQYEQVIAAKPDYIAAHRAVADLQLTAGRPDAALGHLSQALRVHPENSLVHEQIGDIESARGRSDQARAAFEAALKHTSDDATRKRIRKKLNKK